MVVAALALHRLDDDRGDLLLVLLDELVGLLVAIGELLVVIEHRARRVVDGAVDELAHGGDAQVLERGLVAGVVAGIGGYGNSFGEILKTCLNF